MPSKKPSLPDIVGSHQALYYDLLNHRITIKPASELDQVLGKKKGKKERRIGGLAFESVSDISVSSNDNVVIGECLAFRVGQTGERRSCELVFDDFGTKVSVQFTFARMQPGSDGSA
jgi:hypothetical protein